MANAERLQATLAYIEAHPEEHEQMVWRCRTGLCYAGHAAITIAGAKLLRPDSEADDRLELGAHDFELTPSLRETYLIGHQIYISNYARHYLDLTDEQADRLFAGDNTLRRIQEVVTDLVDAAQNGMD